MNSALNPVIYSFYTLFDLEFRKAFKKILCSCQGAKDLNVNEVNGGAKKRELTKVDGFDRI